MSEKEVEALVNWASKEKKWALKFKWPAGEDKSVIGAILFAKVIQYLGLNYSHARVEDDADPEWTWVYLVFNEPYAKVKYMCDLIAKDSKTGETLIPAGSMEVVAEETNV